ncbi:MAG: TRIC cation channel family protein [Candidatus Dormibacteraceae bacterium]
MDAGALSLFAAAGTVKALSRGINPFIATLLGTITAVGGGAMRYVMRWGRSPLSSASTCTRAQRGLVQASSSCRASPASCGRARRLGVLGSPDDQLLAALQPPPSALS